MIQYYIGLVLSSFLINAIGIIPFINFLYAIKFTRRVEGKNKGRKKSKFDKMHDWKAGTPIGGGILIIVIVSILYLLVTTLLNQELKAYCMFPFIEEVHIILFTFIGFGLLGLYDDWLKIFGKPSKGILGSKFGLSGKMKFIIQWFLALLIGSFLYFNLGLDFVHLPFIGIVIPLGVLFIPFAAFVIVAFSNAFNITDGLDGLSCGLLFIGLVAFMVISLASLDLPLIIFLSLLIGALLAFLYFNVFPARIWLGDAGALSFGAILGVTGLLTGKVFALVFIGGLFVLEVSSSLLQLFWKRFFGKKLLPIAPLHLTFQLMGWQEPKIVMRAWLTAIVLAIFGLWLALG